MRALTTDEIQRLSSEQLSDALTNDQATFNAKDLDLGGVLLLASKLVDLIGSSRLKKRVEHLEQVAKAQQAALEKLIEHFASAAR